MMEGGFWNGACLKDKIKPKARKSAQEDIGYKKAYVIYIYKRE